MHGYKVHQFGRHPAKLRIAAAGVDIQPVEDAPPIAEYGWVVDATGSARSMVNAMQFVGFTGRLVWVGITQDELHFTQPIMHRREMTFMASRNALAHEFTRIIRLIEGGILNTDPWITHRAPMADLIGVFPSWLKPETGVVKAMVEVN